MLTEAQYLRLKKQSERDGRSIADLIRAAVDEVYGGSQEDLRKALEGSFGAWADRTDIEEDGAAYVERIRQPGIQERMRRHGWD
jgi:hypothetical protein